MSLESLTFVGLRKGYLEIFGAFPRPAPLELRAPRQVSHGPLTGRTGENLHLHRAGVPVAFGFFWRISRDFLGMYPGILEGRNGF